MSIRWFGNIVFVMIVVVGFFLIRFFSVVSIAYDCCTCNVRLPRCCSHSIWFIVDFSCFLNWFGWMVPLLRWLSMSVLCNVLVNLWKWCVKSSISVVLHFSVKSGDRVLFFPSHRFSASSHKMCDIVMNGILLRWQCSLSNFSCHLIDKTAEWSSSCFC